MEQVLRSREDGGHVILISANQGRESVSSMDMDTVTEYIKYYNIRVSSVVLHVSGTVSPKYQVLAAMSGGVTGTVRVTDDSVWTLAGLNSHLLSAVRKDMSAGAVLPETIHQVSGHYNAEQRGLEWVSQVRNRIQYKQINSSFLYLQT